MNTYKLEIRNYIPKNSTALVGRPNGEKLLKELKEKDIILSVLEKQYDKILISIPQHIVLLNKSFFLGWMETRIQELGKEAFVNKYEFEASDFIKKKISEDYIDSALLTLNSGEILNIDNS